MTEVGQGNLNYDVRRSVKGRNLGRLIVVPLLSVGLIWFGMRLVPETAVMELSLEAVETWGIGTVFGFVCVGAGIYGSLKECVFAVRAYSTTGEWHFRLSDHALVWSVPRHAHGNEEGFEVQLNDVKQIEFRTIEKYEDIDEREYWIHFHSQDPIQLHSYSGVSLSWLAEKINDAGVPYVETNEQY